jgi:hypothetical protein
MSAWAAAAALATPAVVCNRLSREIFHLNIKRNPHTNFPMQSFIIKRLLFNFIIAPAHIWIK